MTGMSSEWFNMVLSLLKRQHHIKVFWSERYIASGLDEFEIDLENGMTLEWGMMLTWQEWPLNVILSFERHSINLSSWWQYTVIRCQSIHSMVIRALEWREMTFLWNDRNDVGMTVLVIPSTFPSFLSSQIAGKNGAILDFIPVIPDYSRHSGVIRKFSTNVNFPRMTSEWRKILSWSGPVSLSFYPHTNICF